ncbi:MAG: hypothetical protein JXA43_00970 [Candidatus Diapherotrites archaeon]|nr:hypothetical protein [Candidatus Diapherotrites archaeon]
MSVVSQTMNEIIMPTLKTEFQDFLCNKKLFLNLESKKIHFKGPLVAKWDHWSFDADITVDENAILGAESHAGKNMTVFRVDGKFDIGRKFKQKENDVIYGNIAAQINCMLFADDFKVHGDMEGHGDCIFGKAKIDGNAEARSISAADSLVVKDKIWVVGKLSSSEGSVKSGESIVAKDIDVRHTVESKKGSVLAVGTLDAEEVIAPNGNIKVNDLKVYEPFNIRHVCSRVNIRKIQAGTPDKPGKITVLDGKSRKLLEKGIAEGEIELVAGEITS